MCFPSTSEKQKQEAQLALVFALSLGYWVSGWAKWNSPHWRSGETLLFVETVSRSDWFSNFVANTSQLQRQIAAAFTAGVQLFGAYALARGLLPRLCWLAFGVFQIFLLLTIHFEQVSIGVLIFQLATWQSLLVERSRRFVRIINLALLISVLALFVTQHWTTHE
jgi:uncharacterized membrane protein YphA (DoxX/SURF4 family)